MLYATYTSEINKYFVKDTNDYFNVVNYAGYSMMIGVKRYT
jgi:hypothetical protein